MYCSLRMASRWYFLVLSAFSAGSAGAATFNLSVCYDGIEPSTSSSGIYFGVDNWIVGGSCLSVTGDTVTGANSDRGSDGIYYWEDLRYVDIWAESGSEAPIDWEVDVHWSYQFEITDLRPGEFVSAAVLPGWLDAVPGSHSGVINLSGSFPGCDRDDVHCDPWGVATIEFAYSVRSSSPTLGKVPLPGAAVLMTGGLLGLGTVARRRKPQSQ